MPLMTIEGIDKAGKDTQSKNLIKRFTQKKVAVEHIAFPDYETPLGKEIRKFLQGKISLRPEVRQLLYVANRWERQKDIETWLKKGSFVVADRYIPSGLAYGLANGLNLEWMLKLEDVLPTTDMVIIIDISVEESYRREKRKDIYEKDKIFLAKVRRSYLELAKKFNWIVLDGEKSVDTVSEEIWEKVSSYFKI